MGELTVSKKIKQLPPDAKRQAQDFIDFLYQRHANDSAKKDLNDNISESSFFGIWKERQEMKNSSEWVSDIRKSQWPY